MWQPGAGHPAHGKQSGSSQCIRKPYFNRLTTRRRYRAFFQLSITGATLTSSSGSTVSLLPGTNPIPVNVSELQTDSVFLGSQSVPAGTYSSLGLTFSPNTQLTIYNGSGAVIGGCANNTMPTHAQPH
jgi:hypothetical protein